jgi:small conductance mechanosensitive channel
MNRLQAIEAYLADFVERGLDRLVAAGISVVFVLAAAWVLAHLYKLAIERLNRAIVVKAREQRHFEPDEIDKRVLTLGGILRRTGVVVIWIIAAMISLKQVGIDIAPILAGAGIVGLAVGFGAQNLVRDVISGFFIILEDQIRMGDVAVVNGQRGTVESINLRATILRDESGVVHFFPNGVITTIANMTKDWSAVILDVSVAAQEDTDRATEVMRTVAERMRAEPPYADAIIAPVEVLGLESFNENAAVVRVRLKTRPMQQWAVGREYRGRLRKAFQEAGIELPSPTRLVTWGGEPPRPPLTPAR